jgi:hypothetical protein
MNLSGPHAAVLAIIGRASRSTNIAGVYSASAAEIAAELASKEKTRLGEASCGHLAEDLVGLGLAGSTEHLDGQRWWVTDNGRDHLEVHAR